MDYTKKLYLMYKLLLFCISKYCKMFGIHVDRMFTPPQPLEVYKVTEYVEKHSSDERIEETIQEPIEEVIEEPTQDRNEDSSYLISNMVESDKTKSYINGSFVQNDINGHLELRLLWKDKKYRWIIDKLNPIFPRYTDFNEPCVQNKILMATLSSASENACTDVYERVKKFAGPNEDFFDRNITMSMLFMNDDLHSDHVLHILRRDGSLLSYKYCDYVA